MKILRFIKSLFYSKVVRIETEAERNRRWKRIRCSHKYAKYSPAIDLVSGQETPIWVCYSCESADSGYLPKGHFYNE